MKRRSLLSAGAALLLSPIALRANTAQRREALLFSAASDSEGNHFLCAWRDGGLQFRTPTAQRAHDVIVNGTRGEIIYFARRPGTLVEVLDARSGEHRHRIDNSATQRHFYGHGCLNRDGSVLYATENAVDRNGRGVIGVYDCNDGYRRLGEFDNGGIGPHQIALMPDGGTLVVGTGGILTLPSQGRRKLNLNSMSPALTYIDLNTEKVVAALPPPDHRLSLRHLDVSPEGTVVVGAQFQGRGRPDLPLVFRHRDGETLEPLQAGIGDRAAYRGYVASVAVQPDGVRALTTTPRGGVASLWDLRGGELVRSFRIPDVAGACYDTARRGFVTSNGRGQLFLLQPKLEQPQPIGRVDALRWDNHLAITGAA